MAIYGGDLVPASVDCLRWRSLVAIVAVSGGNIMVAVSGSNILWRSLAAVSCGGLWWRSLVVAVYKWTLQPRHHPSLLDGVLFVMESRRSSTEGRVHALILSSHIFLGLPCFLFPSFVSCNNSLEVLLCQWRIEHYGITTAPFA